MNDLLWYMASPYSKYPTGIEQAFIDASKQAAFLKNNGIDVFAPIPHSHPIAIHGGLDAYDYDLMLSWDKKFIDRCDGIIVCKMEGWETSHGVNWEIDRFKEQGKPVIYMEPNVVPFKMVDITLANHEYGLAKKVGEGKLPKKIKELD